MGVGIYGIDTGAVWGGKLTAMELGQELRLHQVDGRTMSAGEKAGD
jgi:bis(5'-nucleosyl)-tetraphosphatase (symmetrical)